MCGRGIGALNNFKVVSNYARNFIKTGQSWWKQRRGASMERQTLLLSLKRKIRNVALGKNVIGLAISHNKIINAAQATFLNCMLFNKTSRILSS